MKEPVTRAGRSSQERRKNLMFELVSAACPVVEINAEQIQSSPCIARKRTAAKNAE